MASRLNANKIRTVAARPSESDMSFGAMTARRPDTHSEGNRAIPATNEPSEGQSRVSHAGIGV